MKLTLQITRGILRKHGSRRWAMFVLTLATVSILFVGATFLAGYLSANPFWFLVYWGACAWLTIIILLLAIFDMLVVRAQARAAKRQLREDVFGSGDRERRE